MIGKGIVSVKPFASTPLLWTATTPVLLNQTLITAAGAVFNVTTAGTTGSTAPTTSGTDGTAVVALVPWADIGNCPKFEFKPDIKTLQHFTSRSFALTQDALVVTQVGGKLTFVADEISIYNLSIATLGTNTGTPGSSVTDILSVHGWIGQVQLVQTNTIGKRFTWQFNNVMIIPDKGFSIIDTKFAEMELTGDTLIDPNGKFGSVTEIA
jgi:hypothetical protein